MKRRESVLPNPDPGVALEAEDLVVVPGSCEPVEAFERGIAG